MTLIIIQAHPLNISMVKTNSMERFKQKMNKNIQVNFNGSQEIAYWAKKHNVEPTLFQKIFQQNGNSVVKTLSIINHK
jgi:hypothetical protein